MTMNGNMMRVSSVVSAALSGPNPGASRATSCGAKIIPATQIDPSTIKVSVATLLASRQAAASPLRAMVLLKVVTNAVDRRALGEQIAQQIGDAKGRGEGIHGLATAEQGGADQLARQARAGGCTSPPPR